MQKTMQKERWGEPRNLVHEILVSGDGKRESRIVTLLNTDILSTMNTYVVTIYHRHDDVQRDFILKEIFYDYKEAKPFATGWTENEEFLRRDKPKPRKKKRNEKRRHKTRQ